MLIIKLSGFRILWAAAFKKKIKWFVKFQFVDFACGVRYNVHVNWRKSRRKIQC